MQQTPNLNLNKPDGTDVVDISDLNANMDTIDGKLGTTGHDHSGTAGNGPKITASGLANAAATDTVIGTRTITDTVMATAAADTPTNLFSKIGYMIKSITGKSNWYTLPALTLEAINTLFGTSGHLHTGVAGQGPKIAYSSLSGAPTTMDPAAHASTATTYGVSSATNYGHAKATAATPLINGTAAVGTDNGLYSRGDHVHPTDTTRQPADATLTALAALVTAANQMIYSTGADTLALTALTAFARTLLDDADAATARATLGAAPLDSPPLTGTPTAPTATSGTNTTQLATTAFVKTAVDGSSSIVASGSGTNYYWRKWSNGDIEQWFYHTVKWNISNYNTLNVAFPVGFPNKCNFVIPTSNYYTGDATGAQNQISVLLPLGTTSITIFPTENGDVAQAITYGFYAVGN